MKKTFLTLTLTFTATIFLMSGSCSTDKDDIQIEEPADFYTPGDAEGIAQDIQVFIKSATASENQPGEDILKALDGDYSTIYHSRWNQTLFPEVPVVIEFIFDNEPDVIDYMLYHPRKDGGVNGFILSMDVFTRSEGQDEYYELGTFDFSANSSTRRITFSNGFNNPAGIKLVINEGYNDFVSASQFEFFQFSEQVESYADYFTDLSFSEIKEGVGREQLGLIENDFIRNMALAIYDGVYEEERIGDYSTYPDPAIISAENKTNRMGSYDNMTGIYVKAGEDVVVFVDEIKAELVLRIVDHYDGYGGQDFFLNPGPNRITSPVNGLIYLIYHADHNHHTKVNIASGEINGYFDLSMHTNEDWDKMIANAVCDFFDLKGEKSHITFTTNELKQYVTDATRLVEVYDSIVLLQQELMGLYKYDRVPDGRLYYRTNTSPGVYMHATGNATEYAPSTLIHIANHASLRGDHIWGPAHETGHIHQTRPGLMWIGLTEVTVNIYSQHVQTSFGNASRLQTENISGYSNRYEKAFSEIIAPGLAHGAHDDVFCKLVPFWQLQLYFAKAHDYNDFYKDLHEQIRVNPDPPTDGHCQIEFVKTVVQVAQKDLTEFFEAWGFLTPIDIDINDYGTRRLTVTQQQIDETKAWITQQGYPEPSGVVQYITDATVNIFQTGNSVVEGSGSRSGDLLNMTGWQNVAAFEVYHKDELFFISSLHTFSVPALPSNIKVVAVGVDGSRYNVEL
ncbi:MAG: hypothetical protein EA393_09635 [Bacteroidetes bacterium]|nr:MAG: hypothetical protein EA393_09635 [Bacteroidota bacterium]